MFEKKLTYIEKKRHWIRIPNRFLSLFPTGGPDTLITFEYGKGQKTLVHLDRYNRLFVGSRTFTFLGLDEPGATIAIEKHNDKYRIKKIS